jgi:DNA-binding transcriptional LysR family regulator
MVRVMDGLCAKAEELRAGLEAELSVVLDVMVPARMLVAVLTDFRLQFPRVGVRLRSEVLGGVPSAVMDGSSRLGISGPLFYVIEGLEKVAVGATTLVPVAAPRHPLAAAATVISDQQAREHMQVVLTDQSALSTNRDFAVLASETVRVSDLASKYHLIMAGLGWGNLPEPMVREDLAQGRLCRLELAQWRERPYPMHAIHRTDTPPGPAARWFIDRFQAEVGVR